MKIIIKKNTNELGNLIGRTVTQLIKDVTEKNGQANIILATKAS